MMMWSIFSSLITLSPSRVAAAKAAAEKRTTSTTAATAGQSILLRFIVVTTLFIDISSISAADSGGSSVGDQCDFDKYGQYGCYSRANFYCELATNQCTCLPETPVLIERKFCVKRAKENETCQYNEQCDNDNGLYCSYSDHKLLNNCLSVGLVKEFPRAALSPPRCRCIPVLDLRQQHSPQQHSSHKTHTQQQSSLAKQSRSHQQQQLNQNPLPIVSSSKLPRLVWIFLLVCLIGLILLLLMIKSEFYRLRQSRPRQEDRISINSEADVPPPYEVAIRMKL